jgi:hypothetical protein
MEALGARIGWLEVENARLRQLLQQQWQPMVTCPMDGAVIILFGTIQPAIRAVGAIDLFAEYPTQVMGRYHAGAFRTLVSPNIIVTPRAWQPKPPDPPQRLEDALRPLSARPVTEEV